MLVKISKRLAVVIAFIFISFKGFSTKVDTLKTYSPEMDKQVKSLVILPDEYDRDEIKTFPVLYLLHGFSGDYTNWLDSFPELRDYVNEFNMIVVTPDGGYDSWYLDSPVDDKICYETFMTSTLIKDVDENYRTKSDREHRGIAGLSMGGHGALYLSIRHPELYGAVSSMSGGVDLRPFPDNWNLKKKLGSLSDHPDNWANHSVINLVDSLKNNVLKIFIDIGVDDFFLDVNRNLHQKLLDLKIDHDYIERPGGHTWEYWCNALPYNMLFFRDFFEAKK